MAYSASKAALNSVVKTMSKEFVGRGIRVNAILPGDVDTPMARAKSVLLGNDEATIQMDQRLGTIPVEQIVNQIDYLLSEKSAFMTGRLDRAHRHRANRPPDALEPPGRHPDARQHRRPRSALQPRPTGP